MEKKFSSELIAPCGMNCAICVAHLREKNKCPGCRIKSKDKPKTRLNCKIKNCNELKKNNLTYCCSCKIFPCDKINHLDKRYRTKYDMSMIENLKEIKNSGIKKFLKNQEKKFVRKEGIICVHNKKIY
jgi:hypothetical protein